MKRFLIKVFAFFLPIIVLSYGLDVFISKNLKKDNSDENSDMRDIFNGAVNSDVVIYGSSRAWVQANPQIISDSLQQSTYNLGIDGHSFLQQYLRHRLFLKYNKKPRLIIHSVDFLTFQKRKNLFNLNQFLPYMLFDTLITKYTKNYEGFNYFDYVMPLARYCSRGRYVQRAFLLSVNQADNPPDRFRGYRATNQQYENVVTGPKNYRIRFDPAIVKLFDQYLRQCRRDSIDVIFVYSPEYIEGQKYVSNRDQLFDLIHHFSKKYHIQFYDYSKDSICYHKEYFNNAEHLNKTGSLLYSKKLAADIKHSTPPVDVYAADK